MLKYVLVSLVVLLLPIFYAHRLLGSWTPETGDHVPIENHLSGNALHILETAVDDASKKHCQNVKCEVGLLGYFSQIFGFLKKPFDRG